ncbi:hypothetical protein CS0771_47170 [Catellatospora sp. IY07-71]|uniref:cupin domain-containing protein n=1 Tax=Catellatospora sp. IY07-71 TaxID=2728827 RepID=UPI001BB3D008|nr:cupin domain-containing protein [Catellatospora sp. IY07-71]BCJ75173.1 hypothetical protein CS0771_47170 [Catellatospora sp. IY07-71]
MTVENRSTSVLTPLYERQLSMGAQPVEVMTLLVEIPPGGKGLPPHKHSGPIFGYMIEGEMLFELEGEPERVIKAGEAFFEPGGDVIHYRDANNLPDATSRFVVVMHMVPGQPMLTYVDDTELDARRDRRAPRPQ